MSEVASDWSGFIPELIATAIGAGLGFIAALVLNWKKDKSDENSLRTKTQKTIVHELTQIKNELRSDRDFGAKWIKDTARYKRTIAINPISAFESAVNSGNFSLLSPETQVKFSEIYHLIQYSNALASQIENFYSTPIYAQDANKAEQILAQMSEDLKKYYKQIGDKIEKMLKVSK